jgi:hypothetical protein
MRKSLQGTTLQHRPGNDNTVFAMWKNNLDRTTDAEQGIMNCKNELSHTREHMNKIRESLLANMKNGREADDSSLKEQIEFLLKRL